MAAISPAIMTSVRAFRFMFFVFLELCSVVFVLVDSVSGDRFHLLRVALLASSVGVLTTHQFFAKSKPRSKKPASGLALRMSYFYCVAVEVLLYTLCDIVGR